MGFLPSNGKRGTARRNGGWTRENKKRRGGKHQDPHFEGPCHIACPKCEKLTNYTMRGWVNLPPGEDVNSEKVYVNWRFVEARTTWEWKQKVVREAQEATKQAMREEPEGEESGGAVTNDASQEETHAIDQGQEQKGI